MDILFLAHRTPFPPDRGDKIRSFHILRHLAGRARIHLVSFGEEAADLTPPPAFSDLLASCTIVPRSKSRAVAAVEALASGQPISLTAFAAPAINQAVNAVLAEQAIDAVYCFSGQMAQYLPHAGPPVVMDFVDVDSAKFAGYASRGLPPLRWLMRREARLLGAFERAVATRVAASLLVSEAEAALFRDGGADGRILAVENGIDARQYDPAHVAALPGIGFGRGPLIVFTGQMDYPPNIEAVRWFATAVLPQLVARHPALRFAIVGRAPTAAVTTLAGARVLLTGAVDDVRPWLAAATVCVAPLQQARGIQNKVLEAMAMARPVVASTAAAEGIDHAGTIRVAADAASQVAAIEGLLGDPVCAAALGAAARARVLARYDWAARLAPLDGVLGEIAGGGGADG